MSYHKCKSQSASKGPELSKSFQWLQWQVCATVIKEVMLGRWHDSDASCFMQSTDSIKIPVANNIRLRSNEHSSVEVKGQVTRNTPDSALHITAANTWQKCARNKSRDFPLLPQPL